jgi:hypothetical protein
MHRYLAPIATTLLIGVLLGCDDQGRPILPLPPPPPTSPSPTAQREGWPNSPIFGDPNKYGAPGYYGDWNSRSGVLTIATEGPVTPMCGKPYQLEAGNTVRVANCQAAPQYATLCATNYAALRQRCEDFCAKTANTANPCLNWQLRPHVYEEWGCVGGRPPAGGVAVVPRQFCRTIETCTCTFSVD